MPIGNGGIIGPANVPTLTTASGVWSLREQQQAQGRGAWPLAIAPDPYFEYTTLLLPGNGTDGANNNTFLDGSTNNFTITRNGNTTQGTFSPFSQTGWGNYFDGNGDYLSAGSNSAFAFGTGAYTVELWVYPSSISQQVYVVNDTTNGSVFYFETTGSAGFTISPRLGSPIVTGGYSSLITNSWNHVVFVRGSTAANQTSIFVNGTRVANGTDSTNWTITGPCSIGGLTNNTYMLSGYLSNTRIVKGSAVYDPTQTSITVPTAPLTAISGTSLLTCQSNRFIDNSTNNFTITRNGDTRVVAFSPFNPTLPWFAATNGGSGYFDGNGDSVNAASNAAFAIGTGDFTIEAWIYPISFGTYAYVFGVPVTGGLVFSKEATNFVIRAFFVGDQLQYATLPALNTWTHVAASRSGTTLRMFYNGVQVASTTNSYNFAQGAAYIGNENTNAAPWNGYISNFRLVKGTAVYTGAFTPPTAPITDAGSTSAASYPSTTNVNTSFASSATSLLLNFTNAGIYDATSKNDLETLDNTVNGVRISTAQSQFGGSSIYFDGTGTDYLWIQADQPFQRFGTAPFTIELWIRLAATGSARGLVAKGTSTTGWLVSLNTSNQVVFTYGTSTITSTGTIPASAWRYIAVVREGTGANQTKIYISGVNDGTGTVSTDFTQTSSMYIGADRTGGSLFSGYIQDVRITNGYARTVTTIPTTAFPVI